MIASRFSHPLHADGVFIRVHQGFGLHTWETPINPERLFAYADKIGLLYTWRDLGNRFVDVTFAIASQEQANLSSSSPE